MTDEFAFNARQFFDFSKDHEEMNGDSYFDINEEASPNPHPVFEEVVESENLEMSGTESDFFFSPMDHPETSSSTIFLRGQLRRSLSMGNLPRDNPNKVPELSVALDDIHLDDPLGPPRSSSACSMGQRGPSQEHINRLAQPKRFASQDNLVKPESMTLAQAVLKFQAGTPKRFRSKPSPHINKGLPLPWERTKAHTPKLMTTGRARPSAAISKEEQERREAEESRKFKIKANPVSKRVLKGPLKPQIDKKPATIVQPFQLTEMKKKTVEEPKVPIFKAQPLPKSLHNPFKLQAHVQPPTKAQSPSFSKRCSKVPPNKLEKPEIKSTPQPFKPTHTQPVPFSFEKRDKLLMKKREQYINKVLEEEKRAREFHARPPPKTILRSRNSSHEMISDTSSLSSARSFKRSTEELNIPMFKARPATVLAMKPFEPKKDENHVLKIEAFQLMTDQRMHTRHQFDEKVKEKEALAEAHKKQQEEILKRLEEEEVAKIRKQMEPKAQPIKKYKEIIIQPSNKVTEPVSPKFHTDKIRNKENIQQ